jgi:putative addiction module component (TIGR02574 family)
VGKPTQIPPPGFDKLTVSQKIDYVQFLWDSIAADADAVPVPAWHKRVLDHRMKSRRAGRPQSWGQVRRQIESTVRRRRAR